MSTFYGNNFYIEGDIISRGFDEMFDTFYKIIELTPEPWIVPKKRNHWSDYVRIPYINRFKTKVLGKLRLFRVQERVSILQRNKKKRRSYVQKLRECLA